MFMGKDLEIIQTNENTFLVDHFQQKYLFIIYNNA
jgi:hypothetical protein